MEFLPKEIIQLEILPWLPAKHLIRFKCVSKEWYSLINGITFINLHRKRTLKSPTFDDMILVVPHCLDVRVYTRFDNVLPQTRHNNGTLLNERPAVVVGCCNGLICLELAQDCFGLYDPLTNKQRTDFGLIPPLDNMSGTCTVSREYGFGYDDVGQVYKIVNIQTCLQGEERVHVVNVFSTGTRYWEVVNDFPSWLTNLFCPGVSINNKLHWIANNNTDHEHGCIVTLDLHDQVFGEMSIPTTINGHPSGGCDLMVMGEFLYLYMEVREQDILVDSFAELWVMKEYGVTESWTKLHGFSHRDFPNWWMRKWLIAFKPEEKAMLTTCYHKPTWYNLPENSTTKLDVVDIRYNHADTRHAKPWVCVTTLFQTSTPTSPPLPSLIT